MQKKLMIGALVLILVIIGLYVFKKPPVVEAPQTSPIVNVPSGNSVDQNNQAQTNSNQPQVFTGKDNLGNTVLGNGPVPTTIAQAQMRTISIKNMAFSPMSMKIPKDEEVIWTNNDTVAHTITADDSSIDSGPIAPGASFTFYFTKAETFNYHCAIHPSMKGSIIFSEN